MKIDKRIDEATRTEIQQEVQGKEEFCLAVDKKQIIIIIIIRMSLTYWFT